MIVFTCVLKIGLIIYEKKPKVDLFIPIVLCGRRREIWSVSNGEAFSLWQGRQKS